MKYLDECIFDIYNKDEANRIWQEKFNDYNREFGNVKNKLPKRFLKEYKKCCFHDYSVLGLFPDIKKNYKYSINLLLKHGTETFRIIYRDVKHFDCKIVLGDSLFMFDLLQSEILPAENDCISHEFTVSGESNNSVHIICKRISIRKE